MVRAFASDVTQRGLSVKTAQWRSGARAVSDREFVQALDAALVTAGAGVSRVYALHIDCVGEGDRGGGFGRKVKLVVGDDALKRAREACAGRGEVVRATTTRGATRDGSVRGMLDDERAARMEYYDAASDEMNAFRANTYGRVQMDSVERRSGGGRWSAAPAVKKPTPPAAAATTATTTTTTTKKDTTKDTSTETKDRAVPAKKASNLMSMFAKAPQKKTAPAPKKEEKPAPVVAKEEEKPVAVEKKAVANAEAAILEAEEDASDEDSDDDFGATRKPRRKRAMAVESEDEEDEQPAPEEEDDVMEIEDEPTPAPTPSPKKAPGSSKKTTPTSAKKRKSKAQDEEDDDDQDDAPSSNPTSASKKQKKDKPLSKKALLARRIKKTIEIMDEETGEETTCTIFVDEFENELNEDGSYKFPENVKTAA